MNYSAINIQGNILSSEILEKIRTEDIRYQKAIEFDLNPSATIRDEINLAWTLAVTNWNAFKSKREQLSDLDSGTAETRKYWMIPLFQILGFEITTSNAELINGKSYAISHRATNKDGFPLHIVGVNQSLDKRPETGGTRLSPHALVQEYLNNNEHMYALVSNGRFLRLLRDATRLSRLSYLEFDLEQIMEEGLYVEFALMYRVLHASRMPKSQQEGPDSYLEFYHQEALFSGSRIRERLSEAVESSIKELANGFLKQSKNEDLRTKLLSGEIDAKSYYLHTMRLVYRMLFLLVIEERKLIYKEKRDEELNKKRNIYYQFYSVQRLTKLAEKLTYVDPRKTDLWQSLLTTFALFEYEQYGKKLGIAPLGAGIFSPNALGELSYQLLDNECLLKVLRYLVTFENEQGQRVRVNYADLDVEEFGSVYEGLLEFAPQIIDNGGELIFGFVDGDDRGKTGSHYTPEELVRPLIKHSLDYLIEDKLKAADPEKGLLSLSICDVACGSGHILLSAARRVGFELAKVRSKEDQPTPSVLRIAVRDVIKNCIYGVDLNPLAVELCKVALWLEAHEPGEPLNFLDHHIKCGNAIVGLAHAEELEKGIASEAFKSLPGDDKKIAETFKKENNKEVKLFEAEKKSIGHQVTLDTTQDLGISLKQIQSEFSKFYELPENTPEQIAKKEKAYLDLTNGKKWWRLKNLADLQVAQFFIPKTEVNKDKLTTQRKYMTYLKQGTQILDRGASMAISQEKRFFHWFLEFPEVSQKGGFDCVLGNPPYLGGKKISGAYGDYFLNYVISSYTNTGGLTDLIVYFTRRIFDILKNKSYTSLISTNSLYQGDSRNSGLEYILKNNGNIIFGIRSIKWPGKAKTYVVLLTIKKGKISREEIILDGKKVKLISSFLDNSEEINIYQLKQNESKSFIGSVVNGQGFVIESESELNSFLRIDSNNKKMIFPYINGNDFNSDCDLRPSRHIINFFDWPIEEVKKYASLYDHLLKNVYPERMTKKDKGYREKWWQYARQGKDLYESIKDNTKVLVRTQASKHNFADFVKTGYVYDQKLVVFKEESFVEYLFLNSTIHDLWAGKFSGDFGGIPNYSPSRIYETFPFIIEINSTLQEICIESGNNYFQQRRKILENIKLGLTQIYNLFHSKGILTNILDVKDKQVISLQKHLKKTPNTIDFDEAILEILKLRELHKEMDQAVLEAYGWHQDDPKWGKAIQLRHDFYEVDYLPENDRVRYTIHPEARKEVLKRLLQLNHERYAEEVDAGLHDKKKPTKKDGKKKKGKKNTEDLDDGRIQKDLFPEADLFNQKPEHLKENVVKQGSVVLLKSSDGKEIKVAFGVNINDAQTLKMDGAFAKALLGKSEGNKVDFGKGFEVVSVDN